MTVWITCEKKPEFTFHYRELAQRIVRTVLEREGFPFEAEVSVLLTGDSEIRAINKETRGINAATDVLSFPMLPCESPADFSVLNDAWEIYADPDTGEVPIGDIVLSLDKVRAQADAYGHSERREYAFLLVHSMLHLMGYDHRNPEERAEMEARQNRVLDVLNIKR